MDASDLRFAIEEFLSDLFYFFLAKCHRSRFAMGRISVKKLPFSLCRMTTASHSSRFSMGRDRERKVQNKCFEISAAAVAVCFVSRSSPILQNLLQCIIMQSSRILNKNYCNTGTVPHQTSSLKLDKLWFYMTIEEATKFSNVKITFFIGHPELHKTGPILKITFSFFSFCLPDIEVHAKV